MKLRTTTLFIIGITFMGLVFVLLSSMNAILPPFFQRQEQASAIANVQRGRAALENEYIILELAAHQLASSQAVVNYQITKDPSELNTLLAANIMQDLTVNFVGVLDSQNKVMASVSLPSTYPEITVTQKDVSNIRATYLTILADRELSKEPNSLLNLESGGALFTIYPLSPISESSSTQTLIIGRIIDGKLQTQISSLVLFPVTFIPLTIEQTANQYASITQDLTINSTPVTQIISETEMGGYALLRDPLGKPIFLFEVLQSRTTFESSQLIINYMIIAVVSSAAIFSLMTYAFIIFFILGRLTKLSREVTSIGASGELNQRVTVGRRDEISLLGLNINEMLARLETAQTQLETSLAQVRDGRKRLEDLSRRLVNVQEEERRSIALELHDEIGQTLTGLKFLLEHSATSGEEKLKKQVEKAQVLTNDLIKRVRELSLQLRPSMLDDLGLLPALEWLLGQFTSQSRMHIEFNHQGLEDQRLQPMIEIAAYRIIQEGLTNIARHSGVKKATLNLSLLKDRLLIEIIDLGKGFDLEKALSSGATSGISGMRERVTMLGGEMELKSKRKQGTLLQVELPVKGHLERRKHERNHLAGG